jgi:hypothetical protein
VQWQSRPKVGRATVLHLLLRLNILWREQSARTVPYTSTTAIC